MFLYDFPIAVKPINKQQGRWAEPSSIELNEIEGVKAKQPSLKPQEPNMKCEIIAAVAWI